MSPDVMTKKAMEWIRETMEYIVTPNEARKFLERLPGATPQLQEITQHITNVKKGKDSPRKKYRHRHDIQCLFPQAPYRNLKYEPPQKVGNI